MTQLICRYLHFICYVVKCVDKTLHCFLSRKTFHIIVMNFIHEIKIEYSKQPLQTDDILLKEDIKMEAVSPNGRVIKMSGVGTYNAQFEPDEIGKPWYYKVSYLISA